jgi:hypothetical protein
MNKKIVINAVNGGYFVTVDDRGLPWVYQDMDKMLAKIREELTNETEIVADGPDWVKEELKNKE